MEFSMHIDTLAAGPDYLVLGMSCLEGDIWDGNIVVMDAPWKPAISRLGLDADIADVIGDDDGDAILSSTSSSSIANTIAPTPINPNSLITKSVRIAAGVSAVRILESAGLATNMYDIIVAGRDDGIVALYSKEVEELAALDFHDARVTALAIARGNSHYDGSNSDSNSNDDRGTFSIFGSNDSSSNSKSMHMLASGASDGSLALWSIDSILESGIKGHISQTPPLVAGGGGNSMDSSSSSPPTQPASSSYAASPPSSFSFSSSSIAPINSCADAHNGNISGLDWNESCSYLASCGHDGLLRLWDPRTRISDGASLLFDTAQIASCCHWSSWADSQVMVGLADGFVNVYDVRFNKKGSSFVGSDVVSRFRAHSGLIRKIQTHRHRPGVVVSCSHDRSLAVNTIDAYVGETIGREGAIFTGSSSSSSSSIVEAASGESAYCVEPSGAAFVRRVFPHTDFVTDFVWRLGERSDLSSEPRLDARPGLGLGLGLELGLDHDVVYSVGSDRCLRHVWLGSGEVSGTLL